MNEIDLNNLDFRDNSKEPRKEVDTKTPNKARKEQKRNPPSPQWAYAI
jgi:hypothetical protein